MEQPRRISFDMVVSGRVQHVGFRYFARARAEELELTGYVRNLPDGSLRVVAEGELSALEAKGTPQLTMDNIARVIEMWTKIPASKIKEEELIKILTNKRGEPLDDDEIKAMYKVEFFFKFLLTIFF